MLLHTAQMQIRQRGGVLFSMSWAFNINKSCGQADASLRK
jgi:hypothetical protein